MSEMHFLPSKIKKKKKKYNALGNLAIIEQSLTTRLKKKEKVAA